MLFAHKEREFRKSYNDYYPMILNALYSRVGNMEDDIHFAFENGFRDMRIIIHEAIENDQNYNNEKERISFELIAINNYTYDQAAKHLGLTKRQVVYKYQQVSRRILDRLRERGITRIEDLL